MGSMTVDQVIEAFEVAANAFAKADPESVMALYWQTEDATLANPFGPTVRGWDAVAERLKYASSRFSDGSVTDFIEIARYESDTLVTTIGTEHWSARIEGGDLTDFELRVTTTYRSEAGDWRIVHRHADPIAKLDPRGPARTS